MFFLKSILFLLILPYSFLSYSLGDHFIYLSFSFVSWIHHLTFMEIHKGTLILRTYFIELQILVKFKNNYYFNILKKLRFYSFLLL